MSCSSALMQLLLMQLALMPLLVSVLVFALHYFCRMLFMPPHLLLCSSVCQIDASNIVACQGGLVLHYSSVLLLNAVLVLTLCLFFHSWYGDLLLFPPMLLYYCITVLLYPLARLMPPTLWLARASPLPLTWWDTGSVTRVMAFSSPRPTTPASTWTSAPGKFCGPPPLDVTGSVHNEVEKELSFHS